MLDNTFHAWSDKRFGVVTSMRCIIKAACMWKYKVPKATPVGDMRKLLKVPSVWWLCTFLTAMAEKPHRLST